MVDPEYPVIRAVGSPLTRDMLKPLDARCRVVQFRSMLAEADFAQLAEFMSGYPDVLFRAYGSYDGSITNLDFLRYFPKLRHFAADALYHSLASLDGLAFLPADLNSLSIGWTKRRLSLAGLGRFHQLETLHLEGQTKDIEVLREVRSLRHLTLRSITLPDLSLLEPLKQLRALALKLGGTKNLDLLPRMGSLRYLELWMVKGLSDVGAVGELSKLKYLFLQSMKNVTALPDLDRGSELRGVHLETMKGLKDLTPLGVLTHLEQLAVYDMSHLQPADFQFLIGHPSLTELSTGLGSKKKHQALAEMFDLPRVSSSKRDWIEDATGGPAH